MSAAAAEKKSPDGALNWKPLHSAVKQRRLDDVRRILAEGDVSADVKNPRGVTAFETAFCAGDVEILRALLEAGADADQEVTPEGCSRRPAVHAACSAFNGEVLELLLQFKASPNVKWDDRTPLMLATLNRQENLVKLLLKYGAEVDARDSKGSTALFLVYFSGRVNVNIARALLEAGASPNVRGLDRTTPFFAACSKGDLDHIGMLLQHKANVNKRCKTTRETPLMAALESVSRTDTEKCEIARMLISRGADILARSKRGYTALCAAAESGSLEATRLILGLLVDKNQLDASLNPADSVEYSPLHWACRRSRYEVAEVLLEAGASVNAFCVLCPCCRSTRETPLHAAITCEAPTEYKLLTMEALVAHGADVNVKDSRGLTPLLGACLNAADTTKPIRLLLHSGADVNQRTNVGATPLLFLCAFATELIGDHAAAQAARVLLSHGADARAKCYLPGMGTPLAEAIKRERKETAQVLSRHLKSLPASK